MHRARGKPPAQNRPLSSAAAPAAITSPLRAPLLVSTGSGTDANKSTPRWFLILQAYVWRFLARIAFYLHTFPRPTPPAPSFVRHFTTTALGNASFATLELAFYVPDDYASKVKRGKKYPAVVNFHGGGFTMGRASDDGRWAAVILKNAHALCVSVEYRLAPEFPFPTAVEDGVQALLYLAANADSFGIDPKKMALSGFSAGGNMSFAIPLRLQAHLSSMTSTVSPDSDNGTGPTSPVLEITSIVAWYPSLDARLSRDARRASCIRPDKTLSPVLTSLFDESYMAEQGDRSSPYASPAAASDEDLVAALPNNIAMYLCEWDMLLQEGESFARRLKSLGKSVHVVLIKEKRHGFDKMPNPFSIDPEVMTHYTEACQILRDAFGMS